jgi:hypothetical protein
MSKADMFFDIFVNEYVEIVQDYEVTTNISLTTDGDVKEMRMPMTVSGMVKDSDDYFLFLSTDGHEINQAVPIESIKHIGIVKQSDPMLEMLDDVEPPDEKDFN